MTCSALNSIQAYDGGQAHIIRIGEIQTVRWQVDGIEVTDTLSSASFSILPATGLDIVQSSIDSAGVNYRLTPSVIGEYDLEVTLIGVSGDQYKKLLVVRVEP